MCVTLKPPLPRPGRAARRVPVLVRDTRTIRLVVFHVGFSPVPGAPSARWRRADQEDPMSTVKETVEVDVPLRRAYDQFPHRGRTVAWNRGMRRLRA